MQNNTLNTVNIFHDLDIGNNELELKINQMHYFKIRYKSFSATDKNVKIKDEIYNVIDERYFYSYTSVLDTTIFIKVPNNLPGIKNLVCEIDSNGVLRKYNLSAEFKGHDTTKLIINF
mgnify:FL=1